MKKTWIILEAIKAIDGEFDVETNTVKVLFPLNGLRKCGAFDFLHNHSGVRVVVNNKIII